MTKAEQFVLWCVMGGSVAEVMQPDDGSGYTVLVVTTSSGTTFDVTVAEDR